MTLLVSPTQSQIQVALRNFLLSVLPTGVPVIAMQDNRVGEPPEGDFVAFNPLSRPRLATNIQAYDDVAMLASAAGSVLTASAVTGTLVAGLPLIGANAVPGSVLGAQLSGTTGGAGTYGILPAQTWSVQSVSAGSRSATQKNKVIMQVDVHGGQSSDNIETITTMFRDPYAVDYFGDGMSPLYADDPRQVPFVNAEQQYETRWSVDLHLEADQTVYDIPQQFAAALELDVINVDAAYPA